MLQASVLWENRDNSDEGDGQFNNAPYSNFNDDNVKFDANDVENANDNYGSVSFVLPKSLFIE